MPSYDEYEKELSNLTRQQLEGVLIERERTLSGFHPTHPIRESLIMQINQVKAKIKSGADVVDYGLRSIQSLEKELLAEQKTLSGFHPTHYIRQSLEKKILVLREEITQKKTRN